MARTTAAIRRGRHLSRRGSAMATQEQVDEIIRLAERVHSSDAFRCMDEANAGIGGTMRMLAEARGAGTVVTAGDIAEKLGVTTARVAALLKRLESKGLIARRRSQADARVTEVVLTDEGAARVQAFREEVRAGRDACRRAGRGSSARVLHHGFRDPRAASSSHDAYVGRPRCAYGSPTGPRIHCASCRHGPSGRPTGPGSARMYISWG